MITTIYKCDKCGHEQETNDQMWNIGVSVSHHGSQIGRYETPRGKEMWCRKCIEKLGLLPAHGGKPQKPDEPKSAPPSLEDMVREIVREETS